MERCPNCWSGVEVLAGDCPHCGLPLTTTRRRRRPALIVAVGAVAVVGAGLWLLAPVWQQALRRPADAVEPEPVAARATDQDADLDAGVDRVVPAHWILDGGAEHPVAALAVEGPRGPRLIVPVRALLAAAPLRATRAEVELRVVHTDPLAGYGLLEAVGPWPGDVEPRTPSASATAAAELEALAPDGTRTRAAIEGPGLDARYRVPHDLPVGTAVLDDSGSVLAYVDAAGTAFPIGPAIAWLGQPGRTTIDAARAELRANDPASLVEEATAILAADDPGLAASRRALELLTTAERLTTDRDAVARVRDLLTSALADLVERESLVDAAAALARGQDGLTRFGDDPELLASTARAAVRAATPAVALTLLERLRALDPLDADRVLATIDAAVIAWIDGRATRGDPAEAVAVADQLLRNGPSRADFVAVRARALERAGRPAEAAAEAGRAAALDPGFAALAARLAAAAAAPAPGTVRIPYDPRSGAILASVHIGDRPLRMVVDTGATLTTIPSAIAADLGLLREGGREIPIETASGTAHGQLVRIPRLRIGTLELTDVRAVALDLPGELAGQGLLGLSALRQMDVRLDSETGEIVLERRKRR